VAPTSHETECGPLDKQLTDTRNLKTAVWRKFGIFGVKTDGTYKNTGLERLSAFSNTIFNYRDRERIVF